MSAMRSSRSPWPVAVVSALVGGLVALALAAALGLTGGETTTVVQQAPLSNPRAPVNADGDALTARDIYKRDAPGVVFVRAKVVEQTPSPFGPSERREGEATGSGFVIGAGGLILTNAHVVDGATEIEVRFQDDKRAKAKVLGKDRSTDIALLKVDPKDLELRPLQLGSAKNVEVGDPVVAIGNPFGLDRTLTTGVVSAKAREIQGLNGFTISDVIQTDAAINPGNSGGPLIDGAGRVIGINTQIATGAGGSGNVGIGFAVPIDTAKRLLPDLKKGSVETGYLGVTTREVNEDLEGLNLPADSGVLVIDVQRGGPAAKSGIRGGSIEAQLEGEPVTLGGDIIVAVDGKALKTSEQLASYIGSKRKGDTVSVTLVRDGKRKTVRVKLAERPQNGPQVAPQPAP